MRVLLLSGGVDSLVCLHRDTFNLALFVDYGQLAALTERRLSQAFATGRGVRWQSAVVATPSCVGILGQVDSTPQSAVVPGRNAMLIGLAALAGAKRVTLGCNADDQAAFVDCRPNVLAPVAAACGVELDLPLSGLSKRQVVQLAREIGVPIDSATSCYRGTKCGKCAACLLLATAS